MKMFPVPGNFAALWYTTWQLCCKKIIKIYEIHQFQLKFVHIYRNEVKIIAITYFLATLVIFTLKLQLRVT